MLFGVRQLPGAFAAATLVFALGCRGKAPVPPSVVPASPPDPWVLTSHDPNNSQAALLWNGIIGVRIGPAGNGVGPMFAIDEYQTSGEEKILPLYNPVAVTPTVDGDALVIDPKTYEQSLDMRAAMLRTRWSTTSGAKVEVSTVLLPDQPVLAQRWTLNLKPHAGFSILADCSPEEVLPSESDPKHATWRISEAGKTVTALHEAWADSLEWQFVKTGIRLNGIADGKGLVRFERILTFEPSPLRDAMEATRPVSLSQEEGFANVLASRPTFETLAARAAKTWAKRWQTDIEVDGPVEDQRAIHSFLFYLRSAIAPGGQMSISPFGLSSAKYNGHVFWDADMWVFPALALIDPTAALAIPRYRIATRRAALKNQVDDQIPDKPHITEYEPYLLKTDHPKFAWESSVSGRETAPIAMQDEIHINGDVAWMLGQAAFLGLVPPGVFSGATRDAAKYFYGRASMPEEPWIELTHVTSPDESHSGNNDLYTNLLAQWCMNFGSWTPPDRVKQPTSEWYRYAQFKLPKDKISFLTYDDDPVQSYKQAAAVLSVYPLQYPPAEKQAKVMMERFAGKTSRNGPAMSDSLHALIWARLGQADKAYATWRSSWEDFVSGPFLLFAEKRNRKDTYFTTGAAGCLQTVLYGFLGFRIDSKKQDGAQWSVPLALGRVLSVKPNLPQSWKSVKFKNFTVLGRRYTLIAIHKGVQVIQGDQ